MSSKYCDCVTFRILKYLLSTFPLYTPHCHMILLKQKYCLLLTGVSTESQKRTSHKSVLLVYSKQYDLIDMFNDTYRYLDDIFTIDNPEFEKLIPDISNGTSVEQSKYFRQKTSYSSTETFIPAFTTKVMTLDFLLSISPG